MDDIVKEANKEEFLRAMHFIGGQESDFLKREIYKGINIVGESFDKFCIGTLAVSGAVASTVFVQIETLTRYVQECGIVWCFWMIFGSCISGLLVLYAMILRRVAINNQISIRNFGEKYDEIEWDENFDTGKCLDEVYKNLPCVTRIGKQYAKKRSNDVFFPYQKSAYWTCWQMFFVAFQVLFLVLAFLPLALNIK